MTPRRSILVPVLVAALADNPTCAAFLLRPSTPSISLTTTATTTHLSMAKKNKSKKGGKGFGTQNKPMPQGPPTDFTDAEETLTNPPQKMLDDNNPISFAPPPQQVNQGQVALERMRRQKAEEKDAELRKVKELKQVDNLVKDSPGAAVIPEKVAQRMGMRMLPFVGIPLFGVLGTFVTFWYLAVYKDLEFQTGLVAAISIAVLVVGLLGITYSVMSASWDPDREGSALGVDEFKRNVNNIQDGLSRSRDNLILREKMQGLSEDEINLAIDDLDRRDAKKMKKEQSQSSLDQKLKDELN